MRIRSRVTPRKRTPKPGWKLFAPTWAGLEDVLADELVAINAKRVEPSKRGVAFRGDLEMVYRANIWLRTAHRVLLELAEFESPSREALYEGVARIPWGDHMSTAQTLAVDAVSHRSKLDHTQFISRVVKDAVVDYFRKNSNTRPNVNPRDPDLKLNVRLLNNRATLSIDTSGARLHMRGYRPASGFQAPLKETLAAGVLLKSGYDGATPLVDPMCGSGTLLVEAALMAKNIAPGLLGRPFNFSRHPSFDKTLWTRVITEARAEVRKDVDVPIVGSDISGQVLRVASAAVVGAGVDDIVRLRKADLKNMTCKPSGMVVTNPPYGERLGDIQELGELYHDLGWTLKERCAGMTAHILTASKFLAGRLGLRPKKRDTLFNGAIECRLLHFDLYS